MAENSMKPRIRFKGYTDAWEQRKLGDCIELGCGKDYKHLSEGDIPVYGTGGYMLSVDKALSYEKDGIGIGRKGTIDKPYLLKAPFWTVDTLFFAIPKEKTAIFFLLCLFSKIDWKSKDESTGVPSLSKQTINAVDINVPKTDEQKSIGAFFQRIDNLITLHQRKYDKIVNIKKALLEKMFPADAETTPKIRFSGFTDAWEQRKLGDVGSVAMNRRIFKEQTASSGDVPFYKIGTFGGVADAFISEQLFEEYKTKYPYPKMGDILVSASGSIGRFVEYKGEKAYFQDSNIIWLEHNDSIEKIFLKAFYAVVKWAGLEGSTIKRLYNKNILDTEISLPSVKEQRQVGRLFEQLDNLITLHQRQLEKLKNIKSALLEKMFV